MLILGSVGLGLIMPLHQARAIGWETALQPLLLPLEASWSALKIGYYFVKGGSIGNALFGEVFGQLAKVFNGLITISSLHPPEIIFEVWKIFRNLVNMFFILVLIIMAFGTIFDVHHYRFQDMFKGFLIAALLINFSFSIGTYLIDLSGDISHVFITTIEKSYGSADLASIANRGINIQKLTLSRGWKCFASPTSCLSGMAVDIAVSIIMIIISILMFLVLIVVMVIRFPFVWMLLIVSPVAWLGLALPNIKKQTWDAWWDHFLGWVFWMPAFLFVFMMMAIIVGNRHDVAVTGVDGFFFEFFGFNDLIYFLMTLFFMLGGTYLAFKVGKVFKGSVGAVASFAQDRVKDIRFIPGVGGKTRSISDIEKGGAKYWENVVHEGAPGFLKPIWGGTEKGKVAAQEVAGFFGAKTGYGFAGEAKGKKGESDLVSHHTADKEEEIRIGKTTIEEIKEHFEHEKHQDGGIKLRTVFGDLDQHAATTYRILAKKGRLSMDDQLEYIRKVAPINPIEAQEFIKTSIEAKLREAKPEEWAEVIAPVPAMDGSNIRRDARGNLDMGATSQWAAWSDPGATAARKELYRMLTTEDGKRILGEINDKNDDAGRNTRIAFMENVANEFGGPTSAEFKAFLGAVTKARPDIVVDYLSDPTYAQDPRHPDRVKAEDRNTDNSVNQNNLRERLYRENFPKSYKDLAEVPASVWGKVPPRPTNADGTLGTMAEFNTYATEYSKEFVKRLTRMTNKQLESYQQQMANNILENGGSKYKEKQEVFKQILAEARAIRRLEEKKEEAGQTEDSLDEEVSAKRKQNNFQEKSLAALDAILTELKNKPKGG